MDIIQIKRSRSWTETRNSQSAFFIFDDLSAINQHRLFPSHYCFSNTLSYMKASNIIKDIYLIRYDICQGFLKIPINFTISVQGSWKNAIFCARDVFAVTPFIIRQLNKNIPFVFSQISCLEFWKFHYERLAWWNTVKPMTSNTRNEWHL